MAENIQLPNIEAEGFSPIDTGANRSLREAGKGIRAATNELGEIITEGRAAGANRDMSEIVERVREEELAVEVQPIAPTTHNVPLTKLQDQIKRQRLAIDQGQSKVASLVASEIKQTIADLVVKHPRMADRLHKEYNEFISFNPAFDSLASLDIDRKKASIVAQQDFDRMLTNAETWGIDTTTYPPGEEAFGLLYLKRSGRANQIAENNQIVELQDSIADKNSIRSAEGWRKKFQGAIRDADPTLKKIHKASAQRATFLIEGGKENAADAANWEAEKQGLLDELAIVRLTLARTFDDSVNFGDRDTDRFKQVQGLLDRELDDIDKNITALKADDLDLLQMVKLREETKRQELMERFPRMRTLEEYYRSFPETSDPDRQDTFGKEGAFYKDALGTIAQTGTAEFIASTYALGGEDVDFTGWSSVRIRQYLRGVLAIKDEPFDFPTDNNNWEAQADAADTFLKGQYSSIQNIDPKTSTPRTVMQRLNAINTNLMAFEGHAEQFAEVDETHNQGAASAKFHEAIDIARRDPANYPALIALGATLRDRYSMVESHEQRTDRIADNLLTQLPGGPGPIRMLVKIVDGGPNDKTGELAFEIDHEALDTWMDNNPRAGTSNTLAFLGEFVTDEGLAENRPTMRRRVEEAVIAAAVPFSTAITENFMVQAARWKAENPHLEINYDKLYADERYHRLTQQLKPQPQKGVTAATAGE